MWNLICWRSAIVRIPCIFLGSGFVQQPKNMTGHKFHLCRIQLIHSHVGIACIVLHGRNLSVWPQWLLYRKIHLMGKRYSLLALCSVNAAMNELIGGFSFAWMTELGRPVKRMSLSRVRYFLVQRHASS